HSSPHLSLHDALPISPLAIHSLYRRGVGPDTRTQKEPRGGAILALAGRVGEILSPFFVVREYRQPSRVADRSGYRASVVSGDGRSEEHTSELQSRFDL